MRKSSFPAGKVHSDWRKSAAFSPICLRTGFSTAVAATWRPSAAASFYTSWHRPCGASRGYFAQKRPSERAKSCVFSTIICKGGFPFLRYVSAGAAATFFAAFVPWPVFCFAKLHCIALPPPAFLDLYLFFLVRLFYVCGRRTYLASNASSSVPSSSFSIRSGASRKRLVKR